MRPMKSCNCCSPGNLNGRLSGCQVAGASLVRRGEMEVAVLLVVRRVNYSEQLQIGRWGGGRNWSSDEKMVVDKKL